MNFEHVDGLKREILAVSDSVTNVRFFDPEIALEVIYIFNKSRGKWFLVEIEDNSN